MKRVINQEELRVEWSLDKWYEKTAYVLGVGYSVVLILAMVYGFFSGLATS